MEDGFSSPPSGLLDPPSFSSQGQPDGRFDSSAASAPAEPITAAAPGSTTNPPSKEYTTWRRHLPKRGFTMLPNAHPEPRSFVNNYIIKRPRLLQHYSAGALVDSHGHRLDPTTQPSSFVLSNANTNNNTADGQGDGDGGDTHTHLIHDSSDPATSKLQRDWLNLFIDLLWVGIISNISASFVKAAFEPGSAWGYAFLEFNVLFLTAYRFWGYLRKFLNNFFRKDVLQSLFLTWILVLALVFGTQTPYFRDPAGGKWIIGTFLAAKGSFVALEAVYCIFIPSIRREFLFTFLLSIPVGVLWGSAIAVPWPVQAALVLPAVLLESVVSAIIMLPLSDWFLHGAPKKALDPDNFLNRLQGFFIIVLGEGVFGLVSGNDWGIGLSARGGLSIEALIIYYSLFWLFFTGDQAKTYIHAIYRNRYTSLAFQVFHLLLFASILLVDASIKYLIENSLSNSGSVASGADKSYSLFLARWTISASIDATLLWMTLKALLNRCVDPPGTLLVDNRYLRMAPRAAVGVIFICLPAVMDISASTFLSIILALLQSLIFWEMVAAVEKGAKWFEPKDV